MTGPGGPGGCCRLSISLYPLLRVCCVWSSAVAGAGALALLHFCVALLEHSLSVSLSLPVRRASSPSRVLAPVCDPCRNPLPHPPPRVHPNSTLSLLIPCAHLSRLPPLESCAPSPFLLSLTRPRRPAQTVLDTRELTFVPPAHFPFHPSSFVRSGAMQASPR